MIKGAIFDVDGTILDSMEIWENAGVRYLKSIHVKPEKNLSKILYPMAIEEAAIYMKKRYQLSFPVSEIVQGILEAVQNYYFYEAPLKPGVLELLGEMEDKKIPMVIATSSACEHIEAAFKRLGIDKYFKKIFTCSEVGAGKTKPLVYEKAAEYLRTKPEETWVFEDAAYALETAKNAGFYTVGVYDRFSENEQDELKMQSDIYVRSLAGFGGKL